MGEADTVPVLSRALGQMGNPDIRKIIPPINAWMSYEALREEYARSIKSIKPSTGQRKPSLRKWCLSRAEGQTDISPASLGGTAPGAAGAEARLPWRRTERPLLGPGRGGGADSTARVCWAPTVCRALSSARGVREDTTQRRVPLSESLYSGSHVVLYVSSNLNGTSMGNSRKVWKQTFFFVFLSLLTSLKDWWRNRIDLRGGSWMLGD